MKDEVNYFFVCWLRMLYVTNVMVMEGLLSDDNDDVGSCWIEFVIYTGWAPRC